jgi:hypothetical protein
MSGYIIAKMNCILGILVSKSISISKWTVYADSSAVLIEMSNGTNEMNLMGINCIKILICVVDLKYELLDCISNYTAFGSSEELWSCVVTTVWYRVSTLSILPFFDFTINLF